MFLTKLQNNKKGPARTCLRGACPTKSFRRGFTLVELMVAIAVFSIVMVTAMSALMNVIDANKKAKAVKTAINNISFALEGISKDMRMGTDYACDNNGGEPNGSCNNGGNIIKYRSVRADMETAGDKHKYAYYKFNDAGYVNQIVSCLDKGTTSCTASGPFTPITSADVKLTSVVFYILNDDSLTPAKEQPRMLMTVSGEAGEGKVLTKFDLQTGVSQVTR